MPRIEITVDDVDWKETPQDCADKPWTAWIKVIDDDGRVWESPDAGLGADVREAVEAAVGFIHDGEDHAWLRRSWQARDARTPEEGR